jgi:hypothetical protein
VVEIQEFQAKLMSPFSLFTISPAYGVYETAISWTLAPRVSGRVYIYRSESGTPGSWTLLNPDNGLEGTAGDYLDSTPALKMFVPIYYRGVVDPGGPPESWLIGPIVTALESTTRREYLITREIMRREYRMMASRNGMQMFHYVPKAAGTQATDADLETRQILGPACPGDSGSGFTSLYAGGFHEPVQSWAMIMQMDDDDHKIRPDATGEDPSSSVMLRLLPFPKPEHGHMIVFPKADIRYVIVDPIKRYQLRGSTPLLWEASAMLLDRDDERYRIRPPELLRDPLSS